MISKASAKFIKSLQLKKYRIQEQSFLVEGKKSVLEVLNSDFEVSRVLCTEAFMSQYDQILRKTTCDLVTEQQLSGIGSFKSNDSALAVVKMKGNTPIQIDHNEFGLVLDDINDPGNLGAILRVADWYGISKVIASGTTTDLYNPKVIAASKGSFCRVAVYYTILEDYLGSAKNTIYIADTQGEDIHKVQFGNGGIVVLGNEAHGISQAVMKHSDKIISIPKYGCAESLNVAMATAIICDNIRRGV